MLKRIKRVLNKKKDSSPSLLEIVGNFDLDGTPLTKAILLRAAKLSDENAQWLNNAIGHIKINYSSNFNGILSESACTLSLYIVLISLEKSGISAFLPHDPIPKEAYIVIPFSLFVVSVIYSIITNEGFELNHSEISGRTVNSLFLMHDVEEKSEVIKRGVQIFQEMASSNSPNMKEWRDTFMGLIESYVIILMNNSDEKEIYKEKIYNSFGSMLKELLKCLE